MDYSRFEKTNIYLNFGDVLKINPNLFTRDNLKELDFYTDALTNLRVNIGCKYIPSPEDIEKYIENEECIDEDDIPDFRKLVATIYEKHQTIIYAINKLNEKIITKKNNNFDNEINKQIKKKEKEENDAIKKQEKEKEKERRLQERNTKYEEKEALRKYNHQLITCDKCKIPYVRMGLANHIKSREHITRIDAINWILSKIDGYEELKGKYLTS
jgi:hypothetical protein